MSGETTTVRSPAGERGELVAEALAAAGRHDDERVLAVEGRLHGLALAGAEGAQAEQAEELLGRDVGERRPLDTAPPARGPRGRSGRQVGKQRRRVGRPPATPPWTGRSSARPPGGVARRASRVAPPAGRPRPPPRSSPPSRRGRRDRRRRRRLAAGCFAASTRCAASLAIGVSASRSSGASCAQRARSSASLDAEAGAPGSAKIAARSVRARCTTWQLNARGGVARRPRPSGGAQGFPRSRGLGENTPHIAAYSTRPSVLTGETASGVRVRYVECAPCGHWQRLP